MLSSTAEVLSVLADHLDDGIWLLDTDEGRVLEVNAAGHRGLGRSHAAVLGRRLGEMLDPPMTRDGWRLLCDQVPPTGEHRVTVAVRHANGSTVPVELTLVRTHDTTHHTSGVVAAVARDLSEQVRRAEQAREQRALFDSTIAAVAQGVAVVASDGRIDHANDGFARLVDVPLDRLVDRSVFDPPWTTLDEHRRAVPPEATPAVRTLRHGIPVHERLHCHPGTGAWRAADELVWVRTTSRAVTDSAGRKVGAVLTLTDDTEARLMEDRVERLGRIDELTGLLTRHHVVTAVEDAVAAATRSGGRVGVLHVDVDNFRGVNDTFGAGVGDRVLRTIGERLGDLTDRHVSLGRLGVDEFLVVVGGEGPSVGFDARLARLAEEIQRRTERPQSIDGLELRTTASVGIARWPGDADDAAGLMQAADRALVAARRDGRHQLRFYERSLDEHTRTGLALDRDLRVATAHRQLEVHYQPIIDLRSGRVAAAEALVRWTHPDRGPVPPSVFIPTAEATGAISAISDLVVSTVAGDLARWNDVHLLPAGARIAVNISATEFAQRGFVERMAATLAAAGVSPSQIELEITETLLMSDLETTAARLSHLDELGFLVALDDFGTGYSSLSYLHTLPLHTLKVDRRFVGDLRDGRSETITRAILSLAHSLGIVAVGEGVETEEQRRFLVDAGCDLVQGFFFAPPLPRAAFERFLADRRTADLDLTDA